MVYIWSGILIIGIIIFICYKNLNKNEFSKPLLGLVSTIYVILVLFITILNRERSVEIQRNVLPFSSYVFIVENDWYNSSLYMAEQVAGNMIMFIPMGLILKDVIHKGKVDLKILMLSFCCSVLIECIQYRYNIGTFEVDDIIHNVWGAVIGCGLSDTVCDWSGWKNASSKLILAELFIAILMVTSLCSIIHI